MTYIKACVGIPANMSNVPKREGEGECKSIQVEREGVRKYREREERGGEREREQVCKTIQRKGKRASKGDTSKLIKCHVSCHELQKQTTGAIEVKYVLSNK